MSLGYSHFLIWGTLCVSPLLSTKSVCPSEADSRILFSREPVLPDDCGPGDWTEATNLDVTDISQDCLPGFELVSSPHRLCGVPEGCNAAGSFVNLTQSFTRICGRVTGFTVGDAKAFGGTVSGLDGVIVSTSLELLWIFAAGSNNGSEGSISRCPCDNNNITEAPVSSFGDVPYFCDEPVNGFLWDRQDCMTNCCTSKSPLVFKQEISEAQTGFSIDIINDADQGARVYIQKVNVFVANVTGS